MNPAKFAGDGESDTSDGSSAHLLPSPPRQSRGDRGSGPADGADSMPLSRRRDRSSAYSRKAAKSRS